MLVLLVGRHINTIIRYSSVKNAGTMNYINGILDFLKHGPRSRGGPTFSVVQNASGSSVDCRPWPRPDPDVRLRLSDNNTVRIFGYPNEEDLPRDMWIPLPGFGNIGPPLLYLRTVVPAYVNYIMGEGWRSWLRDDHHTSDAHIFHDGQVILRPSITKTIGQESREDLEALERYHCLRMRRCGAFALRSEVDIIQEETAWKRWPEYLFGWPASGGVWVLRDDPAEDLRVNLVPDFAMIDQMHCLFLLAYKAIMQQSGMNELCRILEEAGGQFYPSIEDCPEVKKLGLLY